MSLTNTLNSALSGLKTYQEILSLRGHNIANANTENYVKKEATLAPIVTDGVGQGVEVTGITAEIDQRLSANIRDQNTTIGRTEVLDDFLTTAEEFYGSPNSSGSLSSQLNGLFSSFSELATTPSSASIRTTALNSAINLTNSISNAATDLQQLRLEADSTIASDIVTINSLLNEIYTINSEIIEFNENTTSYTQLAVAQNEKLQELGTLINVDVTILSDSRAFVSTGNGFGLIDENLYQLTYAQANSAETFSDGTTLSAINIESLTGSPDDIQELASEAPSGEVITSITGGRLKGLLEVRDTILPSFIEELDQLTVQLRDAVNAIHNDGSSLPPATEFTSSLEVTGNSEIAFDGDVLIAVINEDGSPIASPYPNEEYLKPLTLDLGSLNDGGVDGQVSVSSLIDEINAFYGPPEAITSIGNLRNIRLASLSDTIETGGTFDIDFELDNISAQGSTVEITALSIDNGGVLGSALPAAYALNAGATERTNNPITIDLSAGTGGPYTVTATVQVTDEDGNVSSANVEYTVSESASGAINDRFPPATSTNVSGTSSFTSAPSSQRFLTAKLVDEDGRTITDGFTSGFLVLEANGSDVSLAINELDSIETGVSGADPEDITNRGFSHYFGFNNFFVDTYETANAAENFDIRSDIKTNPNNIAVGDLIASAQPSDSSQALYTYELGKSNNNIAQRLSILGQLDLSFDSAGNLASGTQTLTSYMSNVVSSLATRSNEASENNELEVFILEGFQTLFQETSGVNLDEELAEIVIIENNYRAVARIISIIDELFKQLISATGG